MLVIQLFLQLHTKLTPNFMKKFLLALTLLSAATIQAQYTFTTFTESYVNITGGTSLTNGQIWDDPDFTLPFGFPFTIGGQTYTEVQQVGFGSELEFMSPLTSSFLGYLSDIIDGQEIGESASTITYEVSGAAGNRICKLQYFNCAFYNDVFSNEPSADSRVNFQIWFYENGNAIELRFGTNTIAPSSLAHDGAPGPTIILGTGIDFVNETLEYGVSLTGNPNNPTLTELSLDEFPQGLDGNPENGRVYRFAPGTVGVDNSIQEKFSLYPTIAQQELNLRGDIVFGDAYRIISLDGRTVSSGLLSSSTVDVSSLASGTYLFQIDNFGKAQKFVKQ